MQVAAFVDEGNGRIFFIYQLEVDSLIAGTNANTMLVPGYISQFTTVFSKPGDYLIVCHEFCGNGHHVMSGRLIVEEAK